MAQSRVNKVASIFTRINGLLKAGIIPEAEKPLWVDIYKAFPPARDPIYRSAAGLKPSELPKLPPRILYPEDRIRSLYFKKMAPLEVQVLSGQNRKPIWEIFTQVYSELERKGEIESEENLIKATCEELENRGLKVTLKGEYNASVEASEATSEAAKDESNEEFMSILNKAIDQAKTEKNTVPTETNTVESKP